MQGEIHNRTTAAVEIVEKRDFALEFRVSPPNSCDDAALLYPHVVGMIWRMISKQSMDRPAVDRMDASVLLEKFLTANTKSLSSKDLIVSLTRDLELAEGSEEAEALIGLSKFRGRQTELNQISWRSFISVYPKLRAAESVDLSALNEILEL